MNDNLPPTDSKGKRPFYRTKRWVAFWTTLFALVLLSSALNLDYGVNIVCLAIKSWWSTLQ
jgi:hypothetical protein